MRDLIELLLTGKAGMVGAFDRYIVTCSAVLMLPG
jgi:hypothetical protein